MELGKKRLFLLDLDGTVYLEETLLPARRRFSNGRRRAAPTCGI